MTIPEPTAAALPDVVVYAYGLVFLSACTALDDEATTARVNAEWPTGISSRWSVHGEPYADGTPNPSPCNKQPERRHVLFSC